MKPVVRSVVQWQLFTPPSYLFDMLRLLVTGSAGQVGTECCQRLRTWVELVAIDRAECDLERPAAVRELVRREQPDVIVNCAAYTAVDRAESEAERAHRVNADGPALLAEEAGRLGAALIHLSTDYVFDGSKQAPYVESDPPAPLSIYGSTKLAGERAVLASGAAALILRTSWVYAAHGNNFPKTMLRLARERESLRVVDDQWGAPTWAGAIADAIDAMLKQAGQERDAVAAAFRERGGLFHLSAGGQTTWFRFAQRIFADIPDPARRLRELLPITTAQYPTPATRPLRSVLSNQRLHELWQIRLPAWDVSFAAIAPALAQAAASA